MNRQKKQSLSLAPTRASNTGTLCPDGVPISIDWKFFEPGMSIFIPAVDTNKLKGQVERLAYKRDFKVKGIERIEGGLLGMRFWRIS